MKHLKVFKNKKIIITGHTGFKGSWLVYWLYLLGAKVYGISLKPEGTQNHYKSIKSKIKIKSYYLNIINQKKISQLITSIKPDFFFHLAAQALVSKSYMFPKKTIETNVLGTLNILLALNKLKKKCITIIITSDKCYKNKEIKKGYKETDELGGEDFYSSSKASAELIIYAFYKSFILNKNNFLRIATARAGNVIGGGDWSIDRLIPDCVKKWSNNKAVSLRNPQSTRPWQHVLDALNGYLTLSYKLLRNKKINGHSFNFSNKDIDNYSVVDVIKLIQSKWNNVKWKINKERDFYEANLLQLDNKKAKKILKWENKLTLRETINLVSEWYISYYYKKKKILTKDQINYFMKKK